MSGLFIFFAFIFIIGFIIYLIKNNPEENRRYHEAGRKIAETERRLRNGSSALQFGKDLEAAADSDEVHNLTGKALGYVTGWTIQGVSSAAIKSKAKRLHPSERQIQKEYESNPNYGKLIMMLSVLTYVIHGLWTGNW